MSAGMTTQDFDAYIAEIASAAPPLSEEQADRIAAILRKQLANGDEEPGA